MIQKDVEKWLISQPGEKREYFYAAGKEIGTFTVNPHQPGQISTGDSALPPGPKKKIVPFSYIRTVESKANEARITVHYQKDSQLHYDASSPEQAERIVSFLSERAEAVKVTREKDSVLKVIRKPLLAFVGLGLLLGWGYLTAQQLENGEAFREHIAIILLVAGLGTEWLRILMGAAAAIIGLRIAYLIKHNDTVTRVYFGLSRFKAD
ncbi:hypothetical protein CLV84_0102 [Neolewinella xylanilytica]|uniref:Uncharacterized protein n=1 Tax=Neolewinella xylanilytica TaxID=1514080 RepID=A0A2S6I6Q7_9BACT|nr:hypothetical protein [Neolewinella xylanilytica]PPK87167.1 hypothetical protein CLV84_0102 [Neolewinella xylanilytica]